MTPEVLKKKTERYLQGHSLPAETKQIQTWLSCKAERNGKVDEEERSRIEEEILVEIRQQTAYPLFHPRPAPWWKKITTFF